MLLVKPHKRKAFWILLSSFVMVFVCIIGFIIYQGEQSLAKQQAEARREHEALDAQLAAIKKRKAEEKKVREEAERAAAQKASSDAALSAQLKGQVVTPAGCAIKGSHGNPSEIDVVINKKRCFSPIDFTPADLVSYNGYVISEKIRPDLTAMFNAAAIAGVPLSMTSSYRSYTNQVATYNNWVSVNGSTAAADTVSARPGYSEHQTGFAIDFSAGGCSLECFSGSAQYQWLLANGATYGFIQRYPAGLEAITGYSAETWHWRYVGKQTALAMKSQGVKTLEQFWNIPGGGY